MRFVIVVAAESFVHVIKVAVLNRQADLFGDLKMRELGVI
jgi:hypothetical protein